MTRTSAIRAATTLLAALALTGCGAAATSTGAGSTQQASSGAITQTSPPGKPSGAPTEFRPPGDIPDSQIYVPFVQAGRLQVKVPEGWSSANSGSVRTFSDHYNSVSVQVTKSTMAVTAASIRGSVVPALTASKAKFALTSLGTPTLPVGPTVLTTYQSDSRPDPVTGKVVRDVSLRYEFSRNGYVGVVTLTGPTNADNVDPWRIVSNSIRWTR